MNPWLNLARLPKPTVVRWKVLDHFENYNATSWDDEVWLNANSLTESGGWEETLTHELCHVVDKQLMTDAQRARVMACVAGCRSRDMHDVCTVPLEPVWGLGGSVEYMARVGELFAECAARHIWYAVVQKAGPSADLPAFGFYRYDPAVLVPVLLDVLNPKEK